MDDTTLEAKIMKLLEDTQPNHNHELMAYMFDYLAKSQNFNECKTRMKKLSKMNHTAFGNGIMKEIEQEASEE